MSSYWNYRECCEPEMVAGGTPDDDEAPRDPPDDNPCDTCPMYCGDCVDVVRTPPCQQKTRSESE